VKRIITFTFAYERESNQWIDSVNYGPALVPTVATHEAALVALVDDEAPNGMVKLGPEYLVSSLTDDEITAAEEQAQEAFDRGEGVDPLLLAYRALCRADASLVPLPKLEQDAVATALEQIEAVIPGIREAADVGTKGVAA
jgi:hypothetical protein